MFRSFNQVGVTMLIATHETGLIDRFKPRVLNLHEGELRP
jgi:cell division transport system ATP-binding protein